MLIYLVSDHKRFSKYMAIYRLPSNSEVKTMPLFLRNWKCLIAYKEKLKMKKKDDYSEGELASLMNGSWEPTGLVLLEHLEAEDQKITCELPNPYETSLILVGRYKNCGDWRPDWRLSSQRILIDLKNFPDIAS